MLIDGGGPLTSCLSPSSQLVSSHPKLQSLSYPGAYTLCPVCPPPAPLLHCVQRRFSSPSHGARRCTERKFPFHFLLHWWEQFMLGLSPLSLSLSPLSVLNPDYIKLPGLLVVSWCTVWSCQMSVSYTSIKISKERIVLGKGCEL